MGSGESGDVERFRVLFEQNWTAVENYARRRVGGEAASDVAAEAFAVVWRRLSDVPADPLPWLYGVARRVVANHRRSGERADRLVARIEEALAGGHQQGGLALDPQLTVTSSMTFASAFYRLSEPDREVLTLIAWEGLDARGAAVALGCGVGAVTMRLTRARRRLQAILYEGEA